MYRSGSASTLTTGPRPPPLHDTFSSPSPLIPQITPLRSNYDTNTLSPESQDGNAGLDEGENWRPYDRSQATIQDPPFTPEHYRSGGQPSGRVSRTTSRRGAAASEYPPATTTDPPLDFSGSQRGQARDQVYGHTGGAPKSRISLQGGNASRKDASGEDSRESSDRELAFAVAEIGVELNLDRDSENSDEAKHRSRVRRDDRRASRMLPVLILPGPAPDVGGDLVLNVGDGYDQGGPNRDPSRAFLGLIVLWRLTTSRINSSGIRPRFANWN